MSASSSSPSLFVLRLSSAVSLERIRLLIDEELSGLIDLARHQYMCMHWGAEGRHLH